MHTDVVSAVKRSTTTNVTCAPATLFAPGTTSCTVTVTDDDAGTASTLTGAVTLERTGPGTLAAHECTLSDRGLRLYRRGLACSTQKYAGFRTVDPSAETACTSTR